MKNRQAKDAARNRSRAAHVLMMLGGALGLLLFLGVWVRVGAFTADFWTESVLVVGAFLAAALLAWRTLARTALQRKTNPSLWQVIIYAAVLAGLLLMGAFFWIYAMQALGHDASALLMWDGLPALLCAAAIPLLLGVVALQAALIEPSRTWNTRRLDPRAISVIVLLSVVALLLLPGGAAAWGQAQAIATDTAQRVNPFFVVAAGPAAWFAPVLAIGVTLLVGQIALQSLRRPGVVVMLCTAVLFYQSIANFVFLRMVGPVGLDASAHLLALLCAVSMDATYMFRMHIADDRRTLWYALSACVVVTAGAAVILLPGAAGHPPATPGVIGALFAGSALVGLWSGWCGAQFGIWLHFLPDR